MNPRATFTGHTQTCNIGVITCTWITKQLPQDMRWHVMTCTQTAKQFPLDMHRLVILSSYPQGMPRHVILMLLKVHKSSSNFYRTFTDVTLISLRDTNIITHTSQTTSHTIRTDTTWMSFNVFHELRSNIHRIHTNITCTWIANMNVTTCTWIANMWHECHYMYMNCKCDMNCKATSTKHTQTCDINLLGSQTGQYGHTQPSFPNTPLSLEVLPPTL